MNVLVIGGGGREHAIIWKLKQNRNITKIYCITGNSGIADLAECHPEIGVMEFDKILNFLDTHSDIHLTIVAPDDPLAGGLVDLIEQKGYRVFGPSKEAAFIESSKAFSKALMKKYNIPSADYVAFESFVDASSFIKNNKTYPIVVKADGLALGKGVIICQDETEALSALEQIMIDKKFSSAGNKIVIEEFITGKEVSVLCFTDGKTIRPMVSSQDHKRIFDNDKGGNTGGMGTFAPSPIYTKELSERVYDEILVPTMNAMNAEGRKFKGVLYVGLMINGEDIKVLEYNARFGDPETQVILPLLKTDLLEIMNAIIDENLENINIEWEDASAVCVILASEGYPEKALTNRMINIDKNLLDKNIELFHSGTKFDSCGNLLTAGGRVIGVTAKAENINDARDMVYKNIKNISFEGMQYRSDIGKNK